MAHARKLLKLADTLHKIATKRTAALPTFKDAKLAIWRHLGESGWKMSDPKLKVPHATHPDKEIRIWFKAQAIYYSAGSGTNLQSARSLHADIRTMTPEAVVKWVETWAQH